MTPPPLPAWLGIYGRRPVVLSSPHPQGECLQRLAKVTTSRGPASWYLDTKTAGHPDPRLRGTVSPAQIRVARWEVARRNDNAVAWLDARLMPSADGGTVVTGLIKPSPGTAAFPVITAIACLISLGILATGIAQLALGRISGIAPTVLSPIPAALLAAVNTQGRRSLRRETTKLIEEVNGILDSTADFTSPAATPAADSHGA
jgi:hypothetical protein